MNTMYRIGYEPRRDGRGMPIYKGNGQAAMRATIVKAPGVENYQTGVMLQVRSAKPSKWIPGSRVRIWYDFHLDADIDCDNALKALNDAIAAAIGCDDKAFMPCVRTKVTGVKEPYVKIEVQNE